MTYRLKYDPGVEAVHDALPGHVSEELSIALAAACDDPQGATQPYGEDGPYVRMIVTAHVAAVVHIGQTFKTLSVLTITYLD